MFSVLTCKFGFTQLTVKYMIIMSSWSVLSRHADKSIAVDHRSSSYDGVKSLICVNLCERRHGEAYSWQYVNCCVHNIIVGKMWFEHVSEFSYFSTVKFAVNQ